VNKVYPTAQALIVDAKFALQALETELAARTSGQGRPPGNVAEEVKSERDAAPAQYREAMAESPRVYRRLHFLRGWGYEQVYEIFDTSARAPGSVGL
jgi:hypothetical protein